MNFSSNQIVGEATEAADGEGPLQTYQRTEEDSVERF